MPNLSIVIPALGGTSLLEEGLVSVLQHRPAHAEVIVVLTESYADPYDLKDEVRFLTAPRGSGFLACLQVGLQAALAPIVHFLASGRQVEEDWAEVAVQHFDHPLVAAVVPQTLAAEPYAGIRYSAAGRRGFQTLSHSSRAVNVLGPELRAAFYRRTALEAIGGLPTLVGDELADVEIAVALKLAGYQTVFEPAAQVHTAPSGQKPSGALRRGLCAERLFWRNLAAYGGLRSLLAHPGVLATAAADAGSLGAALPYLLGRLLGACQWGSNAAHRRHLVQLQQTPPVLETRRSDEEQGRRIDTPHARAQAAGPHTRSVDVPANYRRSAVQ